MSQNLKLSVRCCFFYSHFDGRTVSLHSIYTVVSQNVQLGIYLNRFEECL